MTTVIVITAKRNGFRRCGVSHSDQPTTWQQHDFTDEQWVELIKEPQLFLSVEERDMDLVLEPRHELASPGSLPQTSFTPETPQSQTLETSATPLGYAVDTIRQQLLGNDEHSFSGANGGDQVGNLGSMTDGSAAPVDGVGTTDQAGAEAQTVADTPVKPVKSRVKPKDDDK
jgi:hypothetical protein